MLLTRKSDSARVAGPRLARAMGSRIATMDRRAFLKRSGLVAGAGAFARPTTVAVAVNTSHLNDADAARAVEELETELGLPAADPVRQGAERLLSAVMA